MLLEYWGIVIYSSHYEAKLKYCWKQQSTIYDGSESAGQQQDGFSNTSDVSLAGHVAKNKYIKLILKRFIIVCLSVWVAPEEKKIETVRRLRTAKDVCTSAPVLQK